MSARPPTQHLPRGTSNTPELTDREELQTTRAALKHFRSLCREYGAGFSVPRNSVFSSQLSDAKKRLLHASRESVASSSSSPDFSEEEETEEWTSWDEIEKLLSRVRPSRRAKAIKEIQLEMSESAQRAEQELAELAERERLHASAATETGEDEDEDEHEDEDAEMQGVYDHGLLGFDVHKVPAVVALQRCASLVPDLIERAANNQRKREAESPKSSRSVTPVEEDDDMSTTSQMDESGIGLEAAMKMQTYGTLPAEASPEMRKILQAQKKQIREQVRKATETERELQMLTYATEFIDGQVDTKHADPELLQAAVGHASHLREKIYADRLAEANHKFEVEHAAMRIPTEDELQAQVLQCGQLARESSYMRERLNRLQAEAAAIFPGAQPQENPSDQRGSPSGSMTETPVNGNEAAVRLWEKQVALDDAPAALEELAQEILVWEKKIGEQEPHTKLFETRMRNAETSLKILEETKTIFLEHIARDNPELLLNMVELESNPASSASSPAPSIYEEEDDMEDYQKLEELENQAQSLELQLLSGEHDPGMPNGNSESNMGNELAKKLQTLVQRLESSKNSEAQSVPPAASKAQQNEALHRIRSLPHKDLHAVMQAHKENDKLDAAIAEAMIELDEWKARQGDLDTLNLNQEMTAKIHLKVRELRALKRRWWSERQDADSTVRPLLAMKNLPDHEIIGDGPPMPAHDGLFDRIHASMTLI